jgi:hypothetical protein
LSRNARAFVNRKYPELRNIPVRISHGNLPRKVGGAAVEGAYGELQIRKGQPKRIDMRITGELKDKPEASEVLLVHELAEAGERVRELKRTPPPDDIKYSPPSQSAHRKALKVCDQYAKLNKLPKHEKMWEQVDPKVYT